MDKGITTRCEEIRHVNENDDYDRMVYGPAVQSLQCIQHQLKQRDQVENREHRQQLPKISIPLGQLKEAHVPTARQKLKCAAGEVQKMRKSSLLT